jgi:hypothetical protein
MTRRRNAVLLGIALAVIVGLWAVLVLRPWIQAKDLDPQLNDQTSLGDELYAMTVEASFQRDGTCWFRGPAQRRFIPRGAPRDVVIYGRGPIQCGDPDRAASSVEFVVGNGTAVITAVHDR